MKMLIYRTAARLTYAGLTVAESLMMAIAAIVPHHLMGIAGESLLGYAEGNAYMLPHLLLACERCGRCMATPAVVPHHSRGAAGRSTDRVLGSAGCADTIYAASSLLVLVTLYSISHPLVPVHVYTLH